MNWVKYAKLYRRLPGRVRNFHQKRICKKDGGEYFSGKLRDLYRNVYHVEVGIGSYGCFNTLQFPEGTKVGNYCSVAPRVHFLFSNHPMDGVSTHPIFYNSLLGYVPEDRIERVKLTVGHDVWIGSDTTITRGCTHIGNGAVIGAGSVVTHDVPPYAVVAGNPARIIRYRVPPAVQDMLEQSKWYMLSPEELAPYVDDAGDPAVFCRKINTYREEMKIT